MKNIKILLGLAFILLVLPFTIAQAYTIDGNNVYFNDSNVFLNANPHSIVDSGWIYFNLTSKQFTGDIDIGFGFDKSQVKPTALELYKPTNASSTVEFTCPQTEGYSFNFTGGANKHFWCWYDDIYYDNDTFINTTTPILVFDHTWETANQTTQTAYWTEYKYTEWKDISNKFSPAQNFEHGGMDLWHYAKNITVTEDVDYYFRAYVNVLPTLTGMDGKYWFVMKPTSKTFQQAIDTDTLYVLDPWFNSTWVKKRQINISENNGTSVDDFSILLNISYDSDMKSDFGDLRFLNDAEDTELGYFIEKKVDGSFAEIWVKTNLTASVNNSIYMYYNNSVVSTTSDFESAFIYADDFEDDSSADWTQAGTCVGFSVSGGRLNMNHSVNSNQCGTAPKSAFQFLNESYTVESNISVSNGDSYMNVHGYQPTIASTHGWTTQSHGDLDWLRLSVGVTVFIDTTVQSINPPARTSGQFYLYGLSLFDRSVTAEGYVGDDWFVQVNGTNTNRNSGYYGLIGYAGNNGARWVQSEWFRVRPNLIVEPTYSVGAEQEDIDTDAPVITILFPANTTYTTTVTTLNYTVTELSPDSCWNSVDGGVTNSTPVASGTNFTGLASVNGSNTWTVYCNDTLANNGSSSVTFIETDVIWFDTDWTRRKPIDITENNATSINNYSVELSIAYDSDMQSDFDDIRFADEFGVELPYYIQEKTDSSQADIWVKLDLTSSATTTIYMYYSNPAVSTTSDFESSFIYADDFETDSSADWTQAGTCVGYSVAGGRLSINHSTNADQCGTAPISSLQYLNESYVVEANISASNGDGYLNVAGYQPSIASNLGWIAQSHGDLDWFRLSVSDSVFLDNTVQSLNPPARTSGQFYHYGLRLFDRSVTAEAFVDDDWFVQANGTNTNKNQGYYGLIGYAGNTGARWVQADWFRVRPILVSEPTNVIGAEEELEETVSIPFVSYDDPVTLNGGANKTIYVVFNVSASDVNETSAEVVVFFNTSISRTSTSCSNVSLTFNCSINLEFYVEAGTWTVNSTILDSTQALVVNDTETFTVNSLTYVNQNGNTINWSGSLNVGTDDNEASNSVIFSNQGNTDFTSFNITGQNSTGSVDLIPTSSFSVDNVTSSTTGIHLVDITPVDVTNKINLKGHGDNVSTTIYFYVDIPSGISADTYTTDTAWGFDLG